MVVKIQYPLFTTGKPEVLIYDKRKTVVFLLPYKGKWKELLGDKLKIYARAHMEKTILVIDEVIPDQSW
jgi:hypothetical protein